MGVDSSIYQLASIFSTYAREPAPIGINGHSLVNNTVSDTFPPFLYD